MKLSIIIPCYNSAKTISKCVKSVIESTYSDKEIVLVNDGSSDNTKCLIDEYADQYENVFAYSKENEGLGKTRNYGIKRCSGELVTFIDSDDCIHPEAYEKMVERLIMSQSDAVYCGFTYIFQEKEKTDCFNCKCEYEDTGELIQYILNEKRSFAGISACTGIYKKEILDQFEASPFLSEREVLSEDKLFNIMYLEKSKKVTIVNKPYYYYYKNSLQSITSTYKKFKPNAALNLHNKLLSILDSDLFSHYIALDFLVSMSACFQQICNDNRINNIEKFGLIREIVHNKEYSAIIKKVNISDVNSKFRILYYLVNHNMSVGIYFLYCVNRSIKK